LVPVDLCAKAMLKLSRLIKKSNGNIFTIADAQPRTYDQMRPIMQELINISINPIYAINGKGSRWDRLFRKLTAQNHIFSQHSFNFCNKETRKLIGDSICSNWEKKFAFFSLLKEGYERFIQKYAD
jgi:hypothetical protein